MGVCRKTYLKAISVLKMLITSWKEQENETQTSELLLIFQLI